MAGRIDTTLYRTAALTFLFFVVFFAMILGTLILKGVFNA